MERRWVDMAKDRGWMVVGGSDYHGDIKPNSVLGSSWVRRETFDKLYAHYEAGSE